MRQLKCGIGVIIGTARRTPKQTSAPNTAIDSTQHAVAITAISLADSQFLLTIAIITILIILLLIMIIVIDKREGRCRS